MARVRALAKRKFAVVRPCPNKCLHVAALCRDRRSAEAILTRVQQAEGVKLGWVIVGPR
jgi:hypothetical protein